jgi:hypothetical protein
LISEPLAEVVNRVFGSLEFQSLLKTNLAVMTHRILATDRSLGCLSGKYLQGSGWAVAARGSYGRGDYCSFSDLDLVLLSESASPFAVRAWRQRCRDTFDDVSVQVYSTNETLPGTYASWLSIIDLRFVCGNRRIVDAFLKSSLSRLADAVFGDLVFAYRHDDFRSKELLEKRSPHYYSIKSGPGGFLENGFGRLLESWHSARRRPLKINQCQLLKENQQCYLYLTVLKEYLHRSSSGPLESILPLYDQKYRARLFRTLEPAAPWFFEPASIDAIRTAQVSVIESLIETELMSNGE